MLKLRQLGKSRIEIMLGAWAEVRRIEEIGIGNHGRAPLADRAMRDESVGADPTAVAESAPGDAVLTV